jgi:hypothetical protein
MEMVVPRKKTYMGVISTFNKKKEKKEKKTRLG